MLGTVLWALHLHISSVNPNNLRSFSYYHRLERREMRSREGDLPRVVQLVNGAARTSPTCPIPQLQLEPTLTLPIQWAILHLTPLSLSDTLSALPCCSPFLPVCSFLLSHSKHYNTTALQDQHCPSLPTIKKVLFKKHGINCLSLDQPAFYVVYRLSK